MSAEPTPAKQLAYALQGTPRASLDMFFKPKSVAVIGASQQEGTVGRTVLWNLLSNPFGGTIYPVNPKRTQLLGIKTYPNVSDLPETVDLAVIATPAPTVPDVIRQCVDAGISGAIIISAGFKESGEIGLEQRVAKEAKRGGLRIIGPNCLGVMSPVNKFNATFASRLALPGNVAFLSQSGALCTAVLDWSVGANVGFSAFVSTGSMLDVGWGDLINHFGSDPQTRSIVIYMESIGDARSFLSAAREVALDKPVIVLKAGRTDSGAKAAASHTGALAGSDEVLEAAFRRSGVLRVNSIDDLFYMAEVLSSQPRPKGPRLTILTNAGGPGVLATDMLIANGGELAALSEETLQSLNEVLPVHWSHHNPVDILGDAGPERYAKAVEIAAKDPGSDGLLVILTPQAMTNPTQTAESLKPYAKMPGKPILASWMGGPEVAKGVEMLNAAGIPTFPYPDAAARAFDYMWRYSYNLNGLYETPVLAAAADAPTAHPDVETMIQAARSSGRTLLTEVESKQILVSYGIPVTEIRVAKTEADAVLAACQIGFPVVLKLHSETITHKTDVGGVQLHLKDSDAVRKAYRAILAAVTQKVGAAHFMGVTVQPMVDLDGYEIIVGSSLDPQFGPVLLFGSGGQLVEVFKDRALALPPLNTTLARRMMEGTKIFAALKGVRGRKPVDLDKLQLLLVQFSQLVVEQRWIREIDINPLLASPNGLLALDARVVLHGPEVKEEDLPRLAIRPYPIEYVEPWTLADGSSVTIRPIRAADEPLLVRFHETLSDRSIHLRYFNMIKLEQRVSHERLTRICFIDYDRQIALVAEQLNKDGERVIRAVGRLNRIPGTTTAEVSLLVSDTSQRKGLGSELMRRLIDVARREKISSITGDILRENSPMIQLCNKFSFHLQPSSDETVVKADLVIGLADI